MKQSAWLGIIVSIAISLLLAGRNLHIAQDDESYLNYFSSFFNNPLADLKDDWWNFTLNEPLWRLYASGMGDLFTAESGFRITLFFSSLLFLLASGRLTHGAWLFIFFTFALDHAFATEMYFNQIRQGVALSIFLTIITSGVNPILGALVATLVHSSFLTVIPCFLLSWAIVKLKAHWFIGVILIITSVFLLSRVAPNIDLGRRSGYEASAALNINHYIIAIVQYGSVLLFFFRQKDFFDDNQQIWLYLSFFYFILVTGLTFIHEAASRLMLFENAFMMILIGMHFKSKGTKLVALFWLLVIFALDLNEAQKVANVTNNIFYTWSKILDLE
jgi:EpsG family